MFTYIERERSLKRYKYKAHVDHAQQKDACFPFQKLINCSISWKSLQKERNHHFILSVFPLIPYQ